MFASCKEFFIHKPINRSLHQDAKQLCTPENYHFRECRWGWGGRQGTGGGDRKTNRAATERGGGRERVGERDRYRQTERRGDRQLGTDKERHTE